MKTAEKYFEEKGVDIGQIVCYYVRGGMGDGIDFDPVEFATDFAKQEKEELLKEIELQKHIIRQLLNKNIPFSAETREYLLKGKQYESKHKNDE